MGYETQLIVGEDTEIAFKGAQGVFFMEHATINMAKMGNSELFNLPWVNETPKDKFWFFFSPCGDGDTKVTQDRYGKSFRPIPIKDVIAALEKDIATDDSYRRLHWALALLRSMATTSNTLSVIMWGH